MASITFNPGGTFTITKDDGTKETLTDDNSSDTSTTPQADTPITPPVGATGGGEGESPGSTNISVDQQSDIDFILEQVEIWLSGDTANGISPNEGKKAIKELNGDPNIVDSLLPSSTPTPVVPDTDGLGGGGTGFGGVEDLFDVEGLRGEELSVNRGGRQQLFNEFIAQSLPAFGGGLARRAAQRRFNPFDASFLLRGGGEFFDEGQSFLTGLGGNAPTGFDIRSQLGNVLGNLAGDPSQFTAPSAAFASGLSDDFSGRNDAFSVANASFGLGAGNPFRSSFSNLLGNRLDQFIGQGGSPLGFLNLVNNQGVGGLFSGGSSGGLF